MCPVVGLLELKSDVSSRTNQELRAKSLSLKDEQVRYLLVKPVLGLVSAWQDLACCPFGNDHVNCLSQHM